MIKFITIDGPPKSGVTSLISAIGRMAEKQGYQVFTQNNNVSSGNTWSYKLLLTRNLSQAKTFGGDKILILWDRSFAHEAVRKQLAGYPDETETLRSEFIYGRPLLTLGPRVILRGPETWGTLREEDDLQLATERKAWQSYAARYNWQYYNNEHDPVYTEAMARALLEQAGTYPEADISTYVGVPPLAGKPVKRIHLKSPAVEWTPFFKPATVNSLISAGPSVMYDGWANTGCDRALLRQAERIIAYRKDAATFAEFYLGHKNVSIV